MLAWNRTVLAAVLCALVAALTAERQQMPGVAGVAGVAALGLLVMVLRDLRRWRPPAASPWTPILHVCSAVIALAALGLTIAVKGLFS